MLCGYGASPDGPSLRSWQIKNLTVTNEEGDIAFDDTGLEERRLYVPRMSWM